jgi:hypothetical protein
MCVSQAIRRPFDLADCTCALSTRTHINMNTNAQALCRGVEGSIAKVVIDRAGRRFTVFCTSHTRTHAGGARTHTHKTGHV